MFGGLGFLLDGHMVCGVIREGALARVGKAREAEVRAMEGVGEMTFSGRRMGGMVALSEALTASDARRGAVPAQAIACTRTRVPKALMSAISDTCAAFLPQFPPKSWPAST